jgi:hypothetical protein
MVAIVDAFRSAVVFGTAPITTPFLAAAAVSVTALLVAAVTFHRAEFRFAENI